MLLTSRITKPRYPTAVVDRLRLYHQLDRYQDVRAVVIHAPAGYGKSSLVSRWIDFSGRAAQAAWLSLDESLADPRLFMRYLAAALEPFAPGVQTLIQPILEDTRSRTQQALSRLLVALEDEPSPLQASDQHLMLVLDDLHRAESPEVNALLTTILENGPKTLHLVLLARRRTALPLARLLAHGRIVALTKEDLRFTEDEIREYLVQRGFARPADSDLAELSARSEGWVTALQLAVLALRQRGSVADLIAALQGHLEWLAEFLTDEVLKHQEPEVRRFLLQTSILNRFTSQLCAAVTGDRDAYRRLTEIGNADLFLIRLDESEGWFRYHHLFQEMLQHRLRTQADTDAMAGLHRRAAAWLSNAGHIHEAVDHLLAAGDTEDATNLVETQVHEVLLRDPYRAQRYLNQLPPALLAQRPRIMLDRCRLAMLQVHVEMGDCVRQAASTLATIAPTDPQLPEWQAELHVLRAGADYYQHLIEASSKAVEQAQPWAHLMDGFTLGSLRFVQMHHHNLRGEQAKARQCAEEALAAYRHADFSAGIVALQRELANWAMRSGRAREATERFQALLTGRVPQGPLVVRELAWAHFSAADNSYWQDHLDHARTHLASLTAIAEGLQDDALAYLANAAAQAYAAAETPCAPDIHAPTIFPNDFVTDDLRSATYNLMARRMVAAGRSNEAWQMTLDLGLALDAMTPDYPDRWLISFCLAYVGRGVDLEAITPLLCAARAQRTEAGNRFGQLHFLVLTAWQQLRLAGEEHAANSLAQAMRLAQETGYTRVLYDIPDLALLLPKIERTLVSGPLLNGPTQPAAAHAVMLTEQEHKVLALLAGDYTYHQIAEELVVSVNTVRTHVRHLYRKLNAHRRDQAVDRARRLGLAS